MKGEKPGLGLLLMGGKDEPEDDGGDDGQLSAASALRKAVTAGDDKAVVEAFKLLTELCASPSYTEEE